MVDENKEYELLLNDLKQRMEREVNPKKIELLKASIDQINNYLNPTFKKMSEEEKNDVRKKIQKEIELINNFLRSGMFNNCNFSCFAIWNKNEKKLKETSFRFVKNTKFKLLKILKNANIIQLKEKRKQCGTSIYVQELDETYVFISKNDVLTKAVTLIHELGHAKVFDIKKTKNTGLYFEEVYPKFLELVFSDYLIENGLEKQGYNVKVSLLNEIKMHIFDIREYDYIGKISYGRFNYKVIKDNILALCIYMMYKKDPKNILNKLDLFINGLGKMNEDELLNIFGLDSSIFSDNKISTDFGELLKIQKEEIKQK